MAKLDTVNLRATDPDAQRNFYCDILGMRDQGDGRVGYSEAEAALRFVQAEAPYTPQPTDLYWKIALSVPNIDLAFEQLQMSGVHCTEPHQFRDVGYLAKVIDPEGFTVELIDHWFEGERPDMPHNETLLGGGAHLSLVTLRTANIADVEPIILGFGMKPLSIQSVEPNGFTLYFYAFTDEEPPSADLGALENRTWVYQRPYTVLEIQHIHSLDMETPPPARRGGYAGVDIASSEPFSSSSRLKITRASPSGEN